MKKRARGKRRGRGQGARIEAQDSVTRRDSATPPPVLLSISPQGVTLPEGVGASSETARLRRELEAHARDVEDFVRAKRFEAIVTRVLADLQPRRDAPRLRLRSSE